MSALRPSQPRCVYASVHNSHCMQESVGDEDARDLAVETAKNVISAWRQLEAHHTACALAHGKYAPHQAIIHCTRSTPMHVPFARPAAATLCVSAACSAGRQPLANCTYVGCPLIHEEMQEAGIACSYHWQREQQTAGGRRQGGAALRCSVHARLRDCEGENDVTALRFEFVSICCCSC